MSAPFTPANNKKISRLPPSTPICNSPSVHLPATPFLTKLGYGTGVSVFLYERSPAAGNKFRSPWAVKKVNKRHAMSQFGDRLEEEAKILKTLSHPNIIGYRAFSKKDDGTHALVMEDGHKSLFDIIEERSESEEGPFSADTIEFVVLRCARALNYLHKEKQIMHGDIKSGNILVVGDFDNVKICDFGVTLPINSEGKVSNPNSRYTGTEAWSPLEVIKDEKVTSKADIFAFGLVVYEMLSLHSPHVDKLLIADSDDEDVDDSIVEEAFRAALGTRPPLPDSAKLDQSYRTVLEIFFAATNEDSDKRPSAEDIINLLENKVDLDDSVLCVNMVQGDQTASAV